MEEGKVIAEGDYESLYEKHKNIFDKILQEE